MHNTTTSLQLYSTTEGWPPIIQVRVPLVPQDAEFQYWTSVIYRYSYEVRCIGNNIVLELKY